MSITGSLTDFSLAEILQFIEKGRKTGLLTLSDLPASDALQPNYYIWVEQGRLVAAANCLDHQGLVRLIEQRQWISDRVFDKLVHWCCPLSEPLGLYLRNQGVLRTEHLKQLFNIQVLQQVSGLLHLKEGQLQFDQNVRTPTREMTGLSISAAVPKLSAVSESAQAWCSNRWKFRAIKHSYLSHADNFCPASLS
jgi:hypothetical protein